MNDLIVAEKIAQWQKLKALVLDSVSSPITKRVYNMALDEFMDGFRQEPRPGGFCRATVSAWRASLEARGLGSLSIIIRMSAIRKLAGEAADNGLIAPELAAGIARVKSVKSTGIRVGNWLSMKQAQALLGARRTSRRSRDCAIELSWRPFSAAVWDGLRWRRSRSRTSSSAMVAGASLISRESTVAFARCRRGLR